MLECAARVRRGVHRWTAGALGSVRAERQSDPDRHEPCADRRRGITDQGDQHRARHLARRRQRQGRPAGPTGRARHLRRSEHAGQCAEHLHQADHGRQSRSPARSLRHQLRRAGDADHHPEQQADDQLHRDRHQRQIPLPEILLDGVGWARRASNSFSIGFFDMAAAQQPKPQTVAILAADAEFAQSAAARRPRPDQEARLQAGLRPELSAEHDGFRARSPRRAGDQPRHRLYRRVPAGQRRHHPRCQRDRAHAEDDGRRDDRNAGDADQGTARADCQRADHR